MANKLILIRINILYIEKSNLLFIADNLSAVNCAAKNRCGKADALSFKSVQRHVARLSRL